MFIVAIGQPNGSVMYHGPFHNETEAKGFAQGVQVVSDYNRLNLRAHVARLTEPGGEPSRPASIRKSGEV